MVAHILELIEKRVADHLEAELASGETQGNNIYPDDYRDDLEGDMENDMDDDHDNQAQSNKDQPDGKPEPQCKEDLVLLRLRGRSLGGLIRELILQILWKASAVFSTTHVGASQLVKKFTKVANEYILDEAAATTTPEAAQI